jgi:hypothetical protein
MKNKLSITKLNKKLKKQLFEKGYYVEEVGQQVEIDCLIVSFAEPKQKISEDKSN